MKLKSFYTKQEDIPKGQEDFYVDVKGTWVLDLDNIKDHPESVSLKKALDKEREDKETAAKKLKTYEGLGLTPDQIKALDADAAKLREEQLKASGDTEAVIKARVDAVVKAKDMEISELKTMVDSLTKDVTTLRVTDVVRAAATKHGVRPEAMDDVDARAARLFTLENGKPVAKENGQVLYGKTGTDPLSPDEWVQALASKAPHLFGETSGSGAGGPNTKPGGAPTGGKFIDPSQIGAHLEDVASGKVMVRQGA